MKKVISFSLWGNNPKYTVGAIRNAELTPIIYPGWVSRFYCSKSVPKEIIENLISLPNTEVIIMDVEGDWTGMFWRFYACEDCDIVLSRDTDSRLSIREKIAVDEWLKSDKDFHIMRDHPYHNTLILGGMWGSRNGILRNIKNLISEFNKGNFYQVDQNFLKEKIYPLVINNSFIHDSFFNYESNNTKFKTDRINQEFVGEVFDEHNIRHPEHFKLIH